MVVIFKVAAELSCSKEKFDGQSPYANHCHAWPGPFPLKSQPRNCSCKMGHANDLLVISKILAEAIRKS